MRWKISIEGSDEITRGHRFKIEIEKSLYRASPAAPVRTDLSPPEFNAHTAVEIDPICTLRPRTLWVIHKTRSSQTITSCFVCEIIKSGQRNRWITWGMRVYDLFAGSVTPIGFFISPLRSTRHLSHDEILLRLVDLNRQRAAEEARGHIRWQRPDYQNPAGRAAVAQGEQTTMEIGPADTATKAPWPKSLREQIAAVRAALSELGTATPDQIARRVARVQARSIQPLLEALSALQQARPVEARRYST